MVYDEANRISSAAATGGGIEYYGYSADSKRFYKYTSVGTEQLTFFGARGEKLGVYSLASTGSAISPVTTNISFAGKAIVESNEPALWRTGWGRIAGVTSVDLSVAPGRAFTRMGRRSLRRRTSMRSLPPIPGMITPRLIMRISDIMPRRMGGLTRLDPCPAAARRGIRRLWNRYSYVGGDPINRRDPRGLDWDYAERRVVVLKCHRRLCGYKLRRESDSLCGLDGGG